MQFSFLVSIWLDISISDKWLLQLGNISMKKKKNFAPVCLVYNPTVTNSTVDLFMYYAMGIT